MVNEYDVDDIKDDNDSNNDIDCDDYIDPVWADADVLKSAGWGTDEDYTPGEYIDDII